MHAVFVAAALFVGALAASAQTMMPVALPPPVTAGGKPLMEALKERHSTREFAAQKLAPQALSNLLWAAFGINRPESDHRTAPSARNWQEIEIYVVMEEGAYRYDAKANTLIPVVSGDHRGDCGMQDFVKDAPLNLVYVADRTKMLDAKDEDMTLYSAADCGFIAQNVYLFCASEGLATVVRGYVDREQLAKTLTLHAAQKVILSQTIGYPKP
jgi:SagB-type dehydrogenase family enzyme